MNAPRAPEDIERADWRLAWKIFRFVLPHRRLVVGSVLVLVFASAITLLGPWAARQAVDVGVVGGDREALKGWVAVFVLLALLGVAVEYARIRLTILTGQRVVLDVRNRVFRHIHSLPQRFFDRTPVGVLVTRATNDVEALAEMFSSGVAAVFHDLLSLVLIVAALFWIDSGLALVTLALLPVVVAVSLWFGGRLRTAFRAMRGCLSRMNGFQQEAFTGIEVTRLCRREATMEGRFEERNHAYRDANFGAIFHFALFGPVVETLSDLARGGLLLLAATRIADATLTWGDFTYFWMALALFFRPLRELADRFNILQSALAASERVFSILGQEPEAPDAPGAVAPGRLRGEVEFRDVHFAYREGEPVLRGVSFRVEPGQTVAIVGPTGAGKTSVISLLSRLWDPQQGAVLVDGKDLRTYRRRELRARVAVVLQDVFLFAGTVEDNIRLGNPGVTPEAIRRACEVVHAAPFLEALPGGYRAEIRERGGNLSVGQKQLLAFARALAADPDILVLDEATSSIDTVTERLIQDAMEKLTTGRTAIIIAHRLSTVRRADRILCMHKGRLVEEGTHEELVRRGGLYARLEARSRMEADARL